MNKIKNICVVLAAVMLSSCGSSFLDREPAGGTVRQDQFEKFSNTLEGSMRGIYAMLYKFSSQDAFGERSIDMYGDILCGDMALTAFAYGWFYCDENGESNTDRTDYLWGYYYGILHNLNNVIRLVNEQTDVTDRVERFGLPNVYDSRNGMFYTIAASDTLAKYSQTEAKVAGLYAEALTMRGYVTQQLIFFYCKTTEEILHGARPYTWETYPTFPIYTETTKDTDNPGYAHLKDTYEFLENDLQTSIAYFEAFAQALSRQSKLAVDINVARAVLAYSYLNKADAQAAPTSDDYRIPYEQALRYATDIIHSGAYRIMRNSEVLSTGFNDIHHDSWMWGQDVTTETSTGLGSFFGQVDIHSYSYSWAGDTKVCDKNLYDAIPAWDIRKKWFNTGAANSTFRLCPDGKFFSAKCPLSTSAEDIDRDWLSDNVFMRYESVYLIAAEAACRLGKYDEAKIYLTTITDERLASSDESVTAAYDAYKSALNAANLLEQITFNWRLEMWGEGYGLQTFRRLTKQVRRGANHLCHPGAVEDFDNGNYLIIIPSNEFVYNPSL